MTEVLAEYATYTDYKDIDVEQLGRIPSHWTVQRFRNAFSFGRGLSITKDDLQEEGIPCVNYGEIHSKFGFEIDPNKHLLKCVSKDFLKKNKSSLLSLGDFVFADTSEDMEGSGNFTQLVRDAVVFAGYHTVIARPFGEENDRRFLAYLCDSTAFRSQIRRAVKGVKVYSITQSILKNTRIWLPSISEQKEISSFLDNKVTLIDAAINVKEQQIRLLKERKQILIQNAVTQGLNSSALMRDSGVEWIGEIPAHWEAMRLKLLFREINKRTSTGEETLFSLRMERGLIPHDEVSDKFIPNESLVDYKIVYAGQMVMNRMRAAIGIFGLATHHGLVSPDYAIFDVAERANPQYFLMLFKLPLIGTQFRLSSKGLGTGSSGFMRLYTESFGDIKVAVPPLNEQAEIVDYIEVEFRRLDIALDLFNRQITKLKEYKATLINSAVTGKFKVPRVTEPTDVASQRDAREVCP